MQGTDALRYWEGRDLTGCENSTKHPEGEKAIAAALVGEGSEQPSWRSSAMRRRLPVLTAPGHGVDAGQQLAHAATGATFLRLPAASRRW